MRKNRRGILAIAIGAAVVLLLFVLPSLAALWVDLHWYDELGQRDVLTTPLVTRIALGASGFAIALLALGTNAYLAVRLARGRRAPLLIGDPNRPFELDLGRLLARLAAPVCALVALALGLSASSRWAEWLLLTHGRSFGEADPIFGRDVGFYVFTLPWLDATFEWIVTLLVLSTITCAVLYVARGAVGLTGGKPAVTRPARIHLSVLGCAIFLALAYGAWLESASVVLSDGGLVAGAGYADVHARLPLLRAHVAVAVVCAALVAISATRRRLVLVAAAIGLYAAVGILGRGVYPALIQTYVVEPNELERERPYLTHEIAATRTAFGLSGVVERELSGDPELTLAQVDDHRETLDNIRLWDHRPLLDTFGQIQEIRTYYEFVSVDNDRYVIDGALRQTMLSPRELSRESLPNRTWINEHFTFTHGYGIALGPVNETDPEGLPVLFVKDIPPESSRGALRVTRPQIYFGELTDEYVFVGTQNREFDHPSATGNVYAPYRGSAGIPLQSTLLRAALAMQLGSFKVLLSEDINPQSRVLLHRQVVLRAARLAPFLRFDRDPYLVVREDGTLVWILDGYTTTDRYPYSRSAGAPSVNYMRNSVKAVVDAYDGSVRFYVADARDPILATWRSIFRGLVHPMREMPADLRAHLRYPLDLFHVQARMLATYHMDSPELLYNREDQWQIPSMQRGRGALEPMEPYYTVMRLPGERDPEFILMLPFTPARKDNLAAWMIARNDGAHLGELVVYEFPNDRLVYGPQQVLNRINQDAHISQQLSLWDQRGSEAHLGTLLVIPIEESLIYVLPLYLRSAGGRIPQLKRVIVVHENRIAMRETLDAAVREIFSSGPTAPPAPTEPVAAARQAPTEPAAQPVEEPPAERTDARVAALRHYEAAVAAQRRGDWGAYGRELEALEQALRAMQPPEPDE